MNSAFRVRLIVGFILLLIILGVVVFFLTKPKSYIQFSQPGKIQTSERKETDGTGVTQQVVDVQGIVTNWNPKEGALELDVNGQKQTFGINPPKTNVLIPLPDNPNASFMIRDKGNKAWDKAFCPKDLVTVSVKDLKTYTAVFAYNLGPHLCR